MGQRLDKLPDKEGVSLNVSDGSSDQAGSSGGVVTTQSVGGISGLATGHADEPTVTSARTGPQTGEPMGPLGQEEHPVNTRGEPMGGDRESKGVSGTAEESKTVQSTKGTRQTSEPIASEEQASESKAVASTGIMEEQGNGMKSETTGGSTNEEDFEVLEKDETWVSSEGENKIVEEIERELSATFCDNTPPHPPALNTDQFQSCHLAHCDHTSWITPEEKDNKAKRRVKPDTFSVTTDSVEAHGSQGQHLAEVTGGRCRLKGGGGVGAAPAETERGKAKREQHTNAQTEGQVSDQVALGSHLTTENNTRSDKKMNNCAENMENILDEEVNLVIPEKLDEEKAVTCMKTTHTATSEPEKQNSQFIGRKQKVGTDQSSHSRFADTVSRRSKAGVSGTKTEDDQSPCSQMNPDPLKAKCPSFAIPQLQDNPSFSLEQCDLIPCPPLPGNDGRDGKLQIASLKRESKLVCFSAVVTSPPLTHLLPERDAPTATQLSTSVVAESSKAEREATPPSCVSGEDSVPKVKIKGPPPPVPKKPKNPFIKMKTAKLMATDVQRRSKDHSRSEEKIKRRHTFHFNKGLLCKPASNQDMCLLWNDMGPCPVPPDIRPLSADLSPWEHLSLGHGASDGDDRYRDMINFDYCVHMAKLSPNNEPKNLDMMQRRLFLERRIRNKSSPPPVGKKPKNPFASTETLPAPEVTPDDEIQIRKPAFPGKREITSELLSDRVSAQVSHDRHGNYGIRVEVAAHSSDGDAENDNAVGCYKPVSKIIKETNQMHKHRGHLKQDGVKPQVWAVEQGPSVKVSQMKNAFDVPKKSVERPPEVKPPPKRGEGFELSIFGGIRNLFGGIDSSNRSYTDIHM